MDGLIFFLLCILYPACIALPLYASTLQELQRLSILLMLSFVGLTAASALFGLMSKDWNISEIQDLLTGSQIMLAFSAFSATVYAIGLWLRGRGWRRNRILLCIYPVFCLPIGLMAFEVTRQHARAEIKAKESKILGSVLKGARADLCPDSDDQLRRIDCVVQLLEPGRLEAVTVIDQIGLPQTPLPDPRR